jgi:threonine/homoserine/homoserine lactone efflux protein
MSYRHNGTPQTAHFAFSSIARPHLEHFKKFAAIAIIFIYIFILSLAGQITNNAACFEKLSLYNPAYYQAHVFDVLAAGFLIGLTHAMPPGPITFEVLRRGISEGFPSAFQVDVGAVAADAVFFSLLAIGLSQVLSHPLGRLAMWLCGCALLTYLGLRGIYGTVVKKAAVNLGTSRGGNSPLATGFLICITSPFAIVWWMGVFGGTMAFFSDTWSLVGLFGGIALACLAWYALLGALGSAGKKFFKPSWLALLSLACSVLMLAFAAILFYRGYVAFL